MEKLVNELSIEYYNGSYKDDYADYNKRAYIIWDRLNAANNNVISYLNRLINNRTLSPTAVLFIKDLADLFINNKITDFSNYATIIDNNKSREYGNNKNLSIDVPANYEITYKTSRDSYMHILDKVGMDGLVNILTVLVKL